MSDNIKKTTAENQVYRTFERLLSTGNVYQLWRGLKRCVSKAVFTTLGLREPFLVHALAQAKPFLPTRFNPYVRAFRQPSVELDFLSVAERVEYAETERVREAHKIAVEEAKKRKREAEETIAYLKKQCLLGKEKEDLARREDDPARSLGGRRLAVLISPIKDPVKYTLTPISRPTTTLTTLITRRTASDATHTKAGSSEPG